MTAESLKKEARRHEQREEWGKALDLYLQAIERREEGEEPDVALHNRVGDLQVRLGDIEGAVGSYEEAIRFYLEAELPNNAIAVCRKIVRHAPDRPATLLRMGQIRAQQGFLVDARQNFIGYAELMQSQGQVEEALRALEEFAGLAPEDVETRLFLADQLKARNRPNEAMYYLSEAYRALAATGDSAGAEGILAQIRAIDPDFVMAPEEETLDATPEAGSWSPVEEWGDPGAGVDEPLADAGLGGSGAASGADEARLANPPEEVESRWSTEGLEITGFGGGLDEAEPFEAETVPLVGGPLDIDSLPGGDDAPGAPPIADAPWGDPVTFDDDEISSEPLPLIHFDLDEPLGLPAAAPGADLIEPTLAASVEDSVAPPDVEPVAAPAPSDPMEALRERLQEDAGDADAWRDLGERYFTAGDAAEGTEALERAHQLYAERGDPERAMRVVRELLIREPRRIELRQRLVEYAHRTNERTLLVQAFLELADGLRAEGDSVKAHAVLEQVLALDPGNIRANEAVGAAVADASAALAGVAPVPPAETPEAPNGGGYVDLGAMVLEPEGEGTTRWVVHADAPSGDEEADFARMLSQFKEKVAQNISMDDARSHYDLGMAYKEMGLLREAIGEFQQALRADPDSLGTFEMLGQCFLDLGDPEVAIRTLERGLKLPTDVEDELLGVYYGLAMANEKVGNRDSARDFYERIFSLDINFKDVVERLKALR